jgi:hypothetical protein
MAEEKPNWVRDLLKELGVEPQEAEAARQVGLELMQRALDSKRELREQFADLVRRVEKLEQSR